MRAIELHVSLFDFGNGVNADGSVTIPEVLRPYMGGIDKLTPIK